jgi:uncharacterized protein
MSQSWRRLTFLHWPYDPPAVRRLLPPGLELDTFDNAAWIGLVPFEIHNLPGVRHFPEINVRTYVVGPDGSRAVWFFSLDAARLAAVIGARTGYGLPYVWASMRVTVDNGSIRYRCRRKWPHASHPTADILVKPGERFLPEELTERDHFLTARYRLYSLKGGRLAYAQVEHEPWPLARATVLDLNQNLIEAAGLPPPRGEPVVHYSERVDVRMAYLRAVEQLTP